MNHATVDKPTRDAILRNIEYNTAINIGSGHDYIEGWTNVDIDPNKNPDIVSDLDSKSVRIPTLGNKYDLVWCAHILEHIHHLPELKQELLRILAPGGHLVVIVPHFLSPDAWGDDTHCRAFSQHSFWKEYWPGYKPLRYTYIDTKDSLKEDGRWIVATLQKPA
jgi:predicted SAM-dependent methyltransferase